MRNQRFLTYVTIVLLMVGGLSALTIYSLPNLLKTQLLTLIQQKTGKNATISHIQLALQPLSIELQDIVIQETNGKPFASFESFYLSLNTQQSIKQFVLVIDKLALVKPVVHIVKQKNGTSNIDDLFTNNTSNNQQSTLFPVTIANLSLTSGKLAWQDAYFKETLQPINLSIANLSTVDKQSCQLSLQLTRESGGQLDWQGDVNINSLNSKGHFKLNNAKLQDLLTAIAPPSVPFNLIGDVLFEGDYQLTNQQYFNLTLNKTKLSLHDFQYAEKNNHPITTKATNFTHEADIKISYANEAWLLTSSHSKMKLNGFEFSQVMPSKNTLKVASFNHQTALNISYAKKCVAIYSQ